MRSSHPEPTAVRTSTGRVMRIGMLPMPGVPSCGRVTLAVEVAGFDRGQLWLSLTGEEALRLAAALTEQAGGLTA